MGRMSSSKYTYSGVYFTSNGAWDKHVSGRITISNFIVLNAHRLLLISVVRPTLECGSEVGNITRLRQH